MASLRPAIVVTGGPGVGERMLAELQSRYAVDYDVMLCDNANQARQVGLQLAVDGVPVAMFATAPQLPDGDGLALLREAHTYLPSAKRLCLVPPDEYAGVLDALRGAATDGVLDGFLAIPRAPRDEEFHTAVVELLSDWGWSTADHEVDGVQIVADVLTPELRRIEDIVQRMGFPHRVYPSSSDVGRGILTESMKRVASASGEGSAVVPLVHAFLSA